MCGRKSVLKCIKYYLKIENSYLKTQTKHPFYIFIFFCPSEFFQIASLIYGSNKQVGNEQLGQKST